MELKAVIYELILYNQIEKNYSDHTIISYEYDLVQFLSLLRKSNGSTVLVWIYDYAGMGYFKLIK